MSINEDSKKRFLEKIVILFSFIRCLPHLVVFYSHGNRLIIQSDCHYWLQRLRKNYGSAFGFIYLLTYFPHFRNLFYYRMGKGTFFLNVICPQMDSLLIRTDKIGNYFYITHGFATAIGAEYIGDNCHIFQHVTIGYSDNGGPTILNNVIIKPGAIIIGKITIGNNVVIGAGATVFRDVPDNCTVFPPTSLIMRWGKSYD